MSARTAAQARRQTIWPAEAAEEALHRRTRLERRVAVVAIVLRGDLLVDVDLDRDHRRLHVLDNVGKAHRLSGLVNLVADLRMRGGGEDINGLLRAEAISGNAETRDHRGHQGKFTR